MDDAAVLVTVFLQAFAHDDVGLVRVDADIGRNGLAIVQNGIQNAVRIRRAGNTMDDMIRLIVKPLTIVNHLVSHLGAGQEGKRADYRA